MQSIPNNKYIVSTPDGVEVTIHADGYSIDGHGLNLWTRPPIIDAKGESVASFAAGQWSSVQLKRSGVL